ncbi:MAG TPA: helical backbone metal receptor [Vicinamibacterales bacterium]|jgi:iron complex transport system substrate-binding protein
MRRLFLGTAIAALVAACLQIGLSGQAQRIVSIIPATTEMLFAMGAGDRLVAVGTYDRFPPEVDRLPRVGALLDPDVERIITLRPDLVVLYGTQADLRTQLDRAGIAYFPYVHRGLSDISETIRALGARVGMARQANGLAEHLEGELADVRKHVAGRPRPKTMLIFGREPGTLRNINSSGGVGFLHDMLETAGGDDVFADVKQQAVITSTEMVLARAPDVIIELHYARVERAAASDLRPWNALASVPAVRNHRIYVLEGEEFVVPGPRVGMATERLSRTIHPDAW